MDANPNKRAGFSLIELLAAVAILLMLTAMMAMIFNESNQSWLIGTSRAESNDAGRAALQLIEQDLQYAVADDILTCKFDYERNEEGKDSYGFTNSEINVVSLQNDSSDGKRTAREINYYIVKRKDSSPKVKMYDLYREYKTALYCYETNGNQNLTWYNRTRVEGAQQALVAENVTAFGCYLPDSDGKLQRVFYSEDGWDDGSCSNSLPEYADICLEILDERNANQLIDMQRHGIRPTGGGGDSEEAFIERNARRYATRVYFHNREGYKIR